MNLKKKWEKLENPSRYVGCRSYEICQIVLESSRPQQPTKSQQQTPPPSGTLIQTSTALPSAVTAAPTPHDVTKFVTMPDDAGKTRC